MTRDEIINRVKVEMDELTPFDGGLIVSAGNEMSKPIDAYIEEILDDCAEDLILMAPIHLLSLKSFSGTISVAGGVASITIPSDFLALGYIKFPEWERQVNTTIKETDPLYLRQMNQYTRAGISKPVVAIRSGKLECYSITSEDGTGIDFKYKAKVVAEQLPDRLMMALVYLTAAKMFKIFERGDLIAPTMELFQNEINIR